MITTETPNSRSSHGVTRRELLQIGALGTAGLALPTLLQARETATSRRGPTATTFGRARACILLFMDGGQPHQDTFDLKPDVPAEVRGEFRPSATNVPGIRISEHFPAIARHADKYAIVRSIHVGSDVHEVGTYAMLTGTRFTGRIVADATRETPDDTPSIGSVIAYLRGRQNTLPAYVWQPFIWRGFPVIAQGYAGFLGPRYDPFRILRDPNAPNFQVDALTLPEDVPTGRLENRRQLLDALNQQSGQSLDSTVRMDSHYHRAFDMLSSPQARRAFDLSAEDVRLRDRYGRHTFGQSVLLARRLVEHGVPLVTVYYNDYRNPNANFNNWDTHQRNFPLLRENLMPSTDRAFSALLEDMADRGLLDDTLVVMMGDFGRTPRINGNGGRDHWGGCACAVLTGAGIRGGQVYGSSDNIAAYPRDNRVSPGDVVATIYHCLGVDPHTELPNRLGRRMRICDGEPIRALLR